MDAMTSSNDWLGPRIEIPDMSGVQAAMDAAQEAGQERWDREVAAAEASVTTADGIAALVKASNDVEQRERTMLRWTIAGVVLAGIAAIASIIAIMIG